MRLPGELVWTFTATWVYTRPLRRGNFTDGLKEIPFGEIKRFDVDAHEVGMVLACLDDQTLVLFSRTQRVGWLLDVYLRQISENSDS